MGTRVAYFVSAHGFGHAARACAVMQRLRDLRPDVAFDIVTTTPRWFFERSLGSGFRLRSVVTDVGLIQTGPFGEDLRATLERLDRFCPCDEAVVERLARDLRAGGCKLVACDIAPLGILAAEAAGIASVLVENFTWDWIYAGYVAQEAGFGRHVEVLRAAFDRATHRIQTVPVCSPLNLDPAAPAAGTMAPRGGRLVVPPVSRPPRLTPGEVRRRIGVADDVPLVVMSTGGFPWAPGDLAGIEERLRELSAPMALVVPGASGKARLGRQVLLLPHRNEFYSPDLLSAADAVVGKLGYGTVVETYHGAGRMAYVRREGFRESAVLARFVEEQMVGAEISLGMLESGGWLDAIPGLLTRSPPRAPSSNGAAVIAEFLNGLLGNG